ncbi:MAG: energy-coupling factor transporter transmembrane component T [Butyricicoccus sp.]|nr:energy-coupling factor transporter transmembrane component T [Butyricicoccus sp.]
MLRDITIGQFFPGTSAVHRVDPRVKLTLVVCMIVTLFLAAGPVSYALLALYILSIIKISGIAPKMVVRGLKPVVFIVAFTAVLNLFYTPGNELWSLGFLHVTDAGIKVAVLMVVRILLLIIGTSMLTYTTSPIDLTDGLELLLGPRKKIHVPVHELAMMMSIALRFIPTLIEETEKIISAQKARGADFDSGNLIQRARAMVPILVPLFISAFRRADELAVAMECRLYRGDIGRTRMKQLRLGRVDFGAIAISAAVFGAVIVLGRFGW